MVSTMKRREERPRSVSPIWNLSPDVREYHIEKYEGSRKYSSNAEVMNILTRMEQHMRERNNQPRIQLQLRDEYFDIEIRKSDYFMEKKIRQRDLEWKKK